MPAISCGIIGLPNVGKSSLFNALTAAGAAVANYPFCTIDPNVGVVTVPDPRLERLNAVEKRSREVPAVIEFIDIAGLVEGAANGEGRGNEFLTHVHDADALLHVVRCFPDPDVVHVRAGVDPAADIRIVHTELLLADLQTAERALAKLAKRARVGEAEARQQAEVLDRLKAHLESEQPARTAELSADDWQTIRDWRFLTRKPVLYAANLGEDDAADPETDPAVQGVREIAEKEGNVCIPFCAKLEAELAELPEQDAAEFLDALGLPGRGLDRLIRACYAHLGLISFFTVGDEEVRAWTIHRDTRAPEAGSVIHTDFQEKFIRVEVTHFPDFEEFGSRSAAKEHGRLHIEGKDYIVQDGDILFFRIGR